MHFLLRQNVLYKLPDAKSKIVGYIPTGELVEVIEEGKDGFSYVIAMNKYGFIKTNLLEKYVDNEYEVYIPDDTEIKIAELSSRPSQFIDLKVLGYPNIHRNLCGEFSVASLGKINVIPLLDKWIKIYPRAKLILSGDKPTGVIDIISMLEAIEIKGKQIFYDYISPQRLKDSLPCIIGVGINQQGKIPGTIRHWVYVEELQNIGNTGIVTLYNPYWNRKEIYSYNELIDITGRLTIIGV